MQNTTMIELPERVKEILDTIMEAGYEAYAVGGCIRDSILGRNPNDWDITTSASPYEIKELFRRTVDTGIQHGTVTVMMDKEGFEVTTYRIDGDYKDGRHPSEVTFTASLKEDLRRRDFTINAMAYNEQNGLVDIFGGMQDIADGVIRCVGEPRERFSEDALRIMRAVRFSAQLGYQIEEKTKAAIEELAPTLKKISAERIQVELVKLLTSDHPQMMRDLYELGLTAVFMPEFDVMMQTPQHNKHHMYSVGEHTLHTLEHVRADKILRLTMLLHDVAKPVCITTDEEGQNHFKKHPVVGADMTRKILRRLKFDNRTTDCCCKLVKEHDDRPAITERNVRRAMSRIGTALFPLLFEVKRADTLGQSMYRRAEKLEYIAEYERVYRKILADHQCVSKKEMKINGSDLIKMGVEPGPKLGDILDRLYEQVLDDPSLNEAQKLKELANKIITSLI